MEKELQSIRKRLSKLPKGRLTCARNGEHFKWYRSDGHTRIYLPKKEQKLAEQLAIRKYLTLREQEINQEIKAIEAYLSYQKKSKEKSIELLNKPGFTELLSNYFMPNSQELLEWANAPYEKNEKYQEHLIYKVPGGVVRSKSESMIAIALQAKKIPYRYECELNLGGISFYPDFTIRHPETGEQYYWEHFGMMDQAEYRNNTLAKLDLYAANGILPGSHLIMTFETKTDPLDYEKVEEVIRQYFE